MITYSQRVLEYKNSAKNIDELVNKTNSLFEEKYFNPSKSAKSFSLPFIPGEIYSFYYKTPTKISKDRSFINRNPIVLCTESVKNTEGDLILKGIDLVVVPMDLRVKIIGRIYDNFYSLIQSNSEGKINPLPLTNSNLKKLLSDTGYENASFGFKTSFFDNITSVSLDDWPYIPYLTKAYIEGMNLKGIYTEYKSKLI
jgi:hypothetical protein